MAVMLKCRRIRGIVPLGLSDGDHSIVRRGYHGISPSMIVRRRAVRACSRAQ